MAASHDLGALNNAAGQARPLQAVQTNGCALLLAPIMRTRPSTLAECGMPVLRLA